MLPASIFSALTSLGKQRAPVADSGSQEGGADPLVEAHAAGDLADVGADLLADVGDLVDEGDLGGEEGVGGELDHLGAGDIGADELATQRLIERRDGVAGPLVTGIGADHHPVGMHEVLNRRALLEELRAGDVGEAGQVAVDRRAGAGRHGALHDQHVLAVVAQLLDHGTHPRQVGVAGAGRRGVDADEEHLRRVEQLVHLGGEGQSLGVAGDQVLEARLVDRQLTARERRDLLGQDVASDHRVSQLGEAGRRHQADPPHPNNADWLLVLRHPCPLPRFLVGFLLGTITLADRAIPIIWSLVSTCNRLFEIQ